SWEHHRLSWRDRRQDWHQECEGMSRFRIVSKVNNHIQQQSTMKRITKGAITTLAVVATLAPLPKALALPTVDLTSSGTASGTIGDVIFTRDNTIPTGTGVFDPFLTVDSPGN